MGSEPSDTIEERIPGSRLKAWLLLEADRRLLAILLLVGFYAMLVGILVVWPASLRASLVDNTAAKALFQALVTALVTAVTLVITINQLVLSQELGAVGDQRDRMEGSVSFRHDVGEHLEEPVSPADPSAFLRAMIAASREAALRLADAVSDGADADADADLRAAVDEYVAGLVENAEDVADRMEGTQFGTYDFLSAALDYNYSWKLYRAEYLRSDHEDALDERQREAFDELIEVLRLFAPAREHFKTLYFQWVLTDLSRGVLYAALPALAVSIGALLYLDTPSAIPGATLGVENVVWVLAGAVTVSMVPFALLLSYVLRIVTVTKRTLAIGAFVLRTDERTGSGGGTQDD